MFALPPLGSDIEPILLADWIEVEVLLGRRPTSLEEFADLLHDDPDLSDEEADPDDDLRGARDDQYHRAESAFGEIGDRAAWLGEAYPMSVSPDSVNTKAESDRLLVYSFLVGLRARQIYKGAAAAFAQEPAAIFEEIVTEAARSYVCGSGRARLGMADRGNQRGDGLHKSFPTATRELARRMNEQPHDDVHGDGDGGTDGIGWRPFGDRRPGQMIFAVQAAIGEGDWQRKPVHAAWGTGAYIQFVTPPVIGAAFPESLSLYPDADLRGANCGVPLDRLRIISLVDDGNFDQTWLQRMESWTEWVCRQLPQ